MLETQSSETSLKVPYPLQLFVLFTSLPKRYTGCHPYKNNTTSKYTINILFRSLFRKSKPLTELGFGKCITISCVNYLGTRISDISVLLSYKWYVRRMRQMNCDVTYIRSAKHDQVIIR